MYVVVVEVNRTLNNLNNTCQVQMEIIINKSVSYTLDNLKLDFKHRHFKECVRHLSLIGSCSKSLLNS